MGHIFDIHTAKLYDAWCRSSQGRAMEELSGRFLMLLLDPQGGEKILDIGCGSGSQLLFYKRLGLQTTGLDASPYMIDRARERLGDRFDLKKGRAEDLPFDDNEFDLATLNNTIEFVDDPLKVLQEAARVSKRGIFAGVMNSLSWFYLRGRVQGVFRDTLFKYAKPYSLWELKAYFKAAVGPAPLDWKGSPLWPSGGFDPVNVPLKKALNPNHWPFGSFLGMSAKILYSLKTDNLPLKIPLKKSGQTVPSGVTMEPLSYHKRVDL
jgi:ubiquinone/menaquinone biosynthesis C-methylase UbiE